MAKSQVDQYSLNVLKQLNTLPLNEETRSIWAEILETKGLNEFLAKEILDLLPTLPKPEDDHAARLFSKNMMVITQNVRQWRLNQVLQHAKSRR